MEFTVFYIDSQYRVHAPSCKDCGREARKDPYGFSVSGDSRQDIALELWSDIASDEFEEGTPEHLEQVNEYDQDEFLTLYLPCTKLK